MSNGQRRIENHPRVRSARVRSAVVRRNGESIIAICEKLKKVVPIHSDAEKAGPITVLLADDHPLVREGLSVLINQQDDMRVVTQAASGREAIEQYFAHRPNIALLDLRMPVMDGIGVLNAICERDPACRVVIISSYDNEEEIYRALLAGAKGYILKDAPVEEIMQCVRTVCKDGAWIPPLIGAKLARRIADQDLTSREVDVLHAVVRGKSNKEIGTIFAISEATVKVHVTHILKKLRVTGRTEAITVAVKRGLVRLEDSLPASF
jgi:DNA-binding NarL/FixJ family response regulator